MKKNQELIIPTVLFLSVFAWIYLNQTKTNITVMTSDQIKLQDTAFIGDSLVESLALTKELKGAGLFGVVGQNTSQINSRFKTQVLDNHYQAVFILGGLNDLASGVSEHFTIANLNLMYRQANSAGLKVIACTLPPWGDYIQKLAQKKGMNPVVLQQKTNAINNWIKSQRGVSVYQVIDLQTFMADPNNGELMNREWLSPDQLHPNANASRAMARFIKNQANIN